jgi:hypothetical protein
MTADAVSVLSALADGLVMDVFVKAGAVAALVALIGLALVLPLYLTHRREVQRLLEWHEREPERGEGLHPPPTAARLGAAAPESSSGWLSPAERVTADRPALKRITAERAALESPSFFRRLIARGPSHPLVLSLIALLVAVVGVALVAILDQPGGPERERSNLDRAAVDLVVLNASSEPPLADKLADSMSAAGFTNVRTGATATVEETVVLFDERQRKAAEAVARELNVERTAPLDRQTRATVESADVVVVAGEDRGRG